MFKLFRFSFDSRFFYRSFVLVLAHLLIFSSHTLAQNQRQGAKADVGTGKSGKDYISLGITLNEFRSVELSLDSNATYAPDGDYNGRNLQNDFPLTAQTYGYQVAYGSYINDYFKAELRMGGGMRDDTLKEALDINLSYWFSGYLGFQHPITDYMNGYFMYGISYYEADTTRRQIYITVVDDPDGFGGGRPTRVLVEPSPEFMEEGLFETRFSPTWMLGLEFDIFDDWYLVFEYGRLLKDSGTNIKVRQAGTHIRYEF
jgi:Outer membrane protein beta-barrel domain